MKPILTESGLKLLSRYKNPILFKFYVWKNLPSLAFWGVKIKSIEADHCSILVPYRWTSQNPFRSIYFSALAGTAELSTGALVQCYLSGRGKWSMLVIHFEMDFVKKAKTTTVFTCNEGYKIQEYIEKAEATGEGQSFDLRTSGFDKDGIKVAKAKITWTIKKKS